MKVWLVATLAVVVLTLGAFFGLLAYSIPQVDPQRVPVEAVVGKRVWERQGCVECHTILGNGGYNGSDLTNEVSRREQAWLEDFFLDPPLLAPHRHRRHPGLSLVDAQDLLSYLDFVNRIRIYNRLPRTVPRPVGE